MEDLKKKLIYYSDKYYNDIAVISDSEYDKLKELYEELSGEQFNNVGNLPTSKLVKVQHSQKMLSLSKLNNYDDLGKWLKPVKGKICIQVKIDGVSLDLEYRKGILSRASTRGNGIIGEDVTHNAYIIPNIPNYIPDLKNVEKCNIRGECVIYKEDFNDLKRKYAKFKTARNLASGSLRLKDELKCKQRRLNFIAYEYFEKFKNEIDINKQLKLLDDYGFDVVPYSTIFYSYSEDIKKIKEKVKSLDKIKDEYLYEIDGVVIKYIDPSIIKSFGSTNHHPKWAKAFKFKNEYSMTTLRDISWGISATGRCNPVAVFDPIVLGGATISRATLHNLDIIREFNLTKDCKIIVERANDVIPYISEKVKDVTDEKIKIVKKCPECNARLKRENQYLFCSNKNCKGVLRTKILAFIKILGIRGLGNEYVRDLVDYLVEKNYDYVHLLDINFDVLYSITNSVKISNKILAEIQTLKENLSPDKALASLFIEGVGLGNSRKILQKFDYELLPTLMLSDFESINGIGKIIAENIYEKLKDDKIKSYFNYFRGFIGEGVNRTDSLNGKYFCITGKLPVKRYALEKEIHANGGYCTSTISKKVDYLIVGEKPGMKYNFAQKEGVLIINYEQYKKLLQGQ